MHPILHQLISILKILDHQVGNIRGRAFVENSEEICTCGALARVLSIVILEERKENLVTYPLSQVFEKARTGEINLIPVGTLTASIIDRSIHIARFEKFKITIAPPPFHKIRMDGFIINA